MRTRHSLKPIYVCVLLVLFAQPALANPIGPSVVNGQASFASTGNALTVTNTPGAIINWQGFSIGANEVTRFAQQSASSAVLNRVVTNNPSSILGSLQSNGRVFLVNPNGIVFGQGSTINVAGLVATSLNMSNADFLAGRYNFTQVPGAQNISNAGNITTQTGGQVYLIAPNVENSGIITAPNGEILLAAGASVDLVNTTNPNLRVNITAPAGDATNVGQLVASAGSLGLFGTVVRNSGQVSADSATMQGGRIVFKASQRAEIAGTVSATSTALPSPASGGGSGAGEEGNGGTIQILGNQVGIMDGATVTANGTQGGGTILIGGDYQGKNPDVPNAQVTYVAPTASISADVTENGNGGKIIVWANDTTRAYGSLSARGGALSGNGGLIETSGHYLDVSGIRIDTAALKGGAGTWLLDPWNVTITTTTDYGGTFSGGTWTPSATGSTITNTTIQTALNAGTSVTITTSGTGTEAGDINVNAPITVTGLGVSPTLTLNAANNIFINSPITKDATATTTYFYLYLNHNALNTAPSSSVTLASTAMIRGVDYVYVQSAGTRSAGTLHVLGTANATTGFIGGGTAQNFHVDDSYFAYSLPFGFTFYGVTYTTMYVASNGIITFGNGTSQYSNNTADFHSLYRMIAPAWSDWVTYTSIPNADIYIHQPSTNSIAVRWDVAHYSNNSATANFEAVLSQSGNIAFNYGAATNLPGHFSTIGVSSGDGVHFTLSASSDTYFLSYLPSATYSYNSATGNYVETLAGLTSTSASLPAPAAVINTLTSSTLASMPNVLGSPPIAQAMIDQNDTEDDNNQAAQDAVVAGGAIVPTASTTPAASLPVCQ